MTIRNQKTTNSISRNVLTESHDNRPVCKNCGERMQKAVRNRDTQYWICTYKLRNNCNYTQEMSDMDDETEAQREKHERIESAQESSTQVEVLPIISCDFIKELTIKLQCKQILLYVDCSFDDQGWKKDVLRDVFDSEILPDIDGAKVEYVFSSHEESDSDYRKQEYRRIHATKLLSDKTRSFTTSQKKGLTKMKKCTPIYNAEAYDEYVNDNRGKHDLVISDIEVVGLGFDKDIFIIQKLLPLLEDTGIGIFLVDREFGRTASEKEFVKQLKNEGFYLRGMILVEPVSVMFDTLGSSSFAIFSKRKNDSVFFAKLNDGNDVKSVIDNLLAMKATKKLAEGVLLSLDSFVGFENYESTMKITNLQKNYSEYKKLYLRDLVVQISDAVHVTKEKSNTLYIPKDEKKLNDVHTDITEYGNEKNIECYQLVCNRDLVYAEYLRGYFMSKMGQLSLSTALELNFDIIFNEDGTLRTEQLKGKQLSKLYLEGLVIPIPSLDLQKSIFTAQNKIHELSVFLRDTKMDVSFNPDSANNIIEKASSALNALQGDRRIQEVDELIQKGESPRRIFMEMRNEEDMNRLFKQINSYVNGDGGDILVGIQYGKVVGIDSKTLTKDIINKLNDGYNKSVDYRELDYLTQQTSKTVIQIRCQSQRTINPSEVIDRLRGKNKKYKIAMLGEFQNKSELKKQVKALISDEYFYKLAKLDVDFYNNKKLNTKGVVKSFKRGQSAYSMLIVGQIHKHSSKGNEKANIVTELKDNQKYIDSISADSPRNKPPVAKVINALSEYLRNKESG